MSGDRHLVWSTPDEGGTRTSRVLAEVAVIPGWTVAISRAAHGQDPACAWGLPSEYSGVQVGLFGFEVTVWQPSGRTWRTQHSGGSPVELQPERRLTVHHQVKCAFFSVAQLSDSFSSKFGFNEKAK